LNNPEVIVFRELTKAFETVYRGRAEDILKQLEKEGPRGEFVVIIKK
jgi:16S rRNA C1402 (ribose-2'-O) methylase RsmI